MSAEARNVYMVELTLRILTTAENVLFWLTRQSNISQVVLLLTLSIASTDLFTHFTIICPQQSGFCLDTFVLPLCLVLFFRGFAHEMPHVNIHHKWSLFKVQLLWLILTNAETPVLWSPDVKRWLVGKDWGQEETRVIEDEIVGWNHRLSGH